MKKSFNLKNLNSNKLKPRCWKFLTKAQTCLVRQAYCLHTVPFMNTNAMEGTGEPYSQILTPLTPLFSYSQLETLLCAWVPHRLDGILERRGLKSGLYVIDHFVVTATIALLLVSVKLLVTYIKHTLEKRHAPSERQYQSISVTIHPFITDSYHNS